MIDILEQKIIEVKKFALLNNCLLVGEKQINYGVQLIFLSSGCKICINVYSGKKGISIVIAGKESTLKEVFVQQYNKDKRSFLRKGESTTNNNANKVDFADKIVIGCDEAGKGDYFGALVTAAFLMRPEYREKIKLLGVKDCKLLSDNKVISIAEKIAAEYTGDFFIKCLYPLEYNERYDALSKEGKNLNNLLAECHAALIDKMISSFGKKCDLVLVDKFANEKVLLAEITQNVRNQVTIKQETHAERNLAVATASILARAYFLKTIEKLSLRMHCKLPKGAGIEVNRTITELSKIKSEQDLKSIAKWHFKLTKENI